MERHTNSHAIPIAIPHSYAVARTAVAHLPRVKAWGENSAYFALIVVIWAAVIYWALVSAAS